MRTAHVSIKIKDKDVTRVLTPYLISVQFTDKSDDELDDLQIVLEDREFKFQDKWMPKEGYKIEASIYTVNFFRNNEKSILNCGEFQIDEIELESSFDGGDIITIKALPFVVKTSLMQQKKTRAWEGVHMKDVVADIAGEAGLDTLYKAPDIVFERVEQREEHDLEFLQRICKEQGLRLCLKKGRVIVYFGQTADSTEPIKIDRKTCNISDFYFKKTTNEIYKECRVGYTDPNDSETKVGNYKPSDNINTGKVLLINERIEDPAQAERRAIAALRDKNSQEYTGSFSSLGDTRLIAGRTLDIKGFGKFDQKYVIKQATHNLDKDGGYRTSIELEKALGY